MRCIRVSCSCVLLQGAVGGSAAATEAEEDSEGAGRTTAAAAAAAAAVLLIDCWKALGERSTEIPGPGTARPGLMGTF